MLHGTSNIKSASHKHHMFSVSAAEYTYVTCNFSLMGLCVSDCLDYITVDIITHEYTVHLLQVCNSMQYSY